MEKKRIYTLWWQGIENAPDIVKVCHESLIRAHDERTQEIIYLDKENIFDYVEFPSYILDKFNRGIISITHLSDIARTMLLGETGGLWVDATMLFPQKIDDAIFEKDFFTLKNPSANSQSITSKWECFFIAGKKDFPLFSLLRDMWLEYWKYEDDLIDYLLIDHVFYIGYKENKEIRKALDECASFHYRIDYFQKFMNKKYNRETFKEICKNEPYIKMTYKGMLEEKTPEGEMTFYGKLIEGYLK